MLSQLRRGHHHEFNDPMSARTTKNHGEHWKSSDRANSSILNNNILPNAYSPRLNTSTITPDLSRAFRVDAYLLAIIRIEYKRNSFYSTDVVSKLRQKEQTQSFINKPCSLLVTDRSLIIYDRGTQVIAETIPLENVDPTCVYSDVPDTLNDIFMYRLYDRHSSTATNQSTSSHKNDLSSVIVFKCTNKESKLLVDSIRNASGKLLKTPRSARSETRSTIDRRITDAGSMAFYDPLQLPYDHSSMNPTYVVGPQHTSRAMAQQNSSIVSTDYYTRLTDELNKCFDDIELFVRYLEALMEYTRELDRDYRRKDKKPIVGLKQMVEKLPDDKFFIDILQKFKYSFNLLGELKHIIHNPNAPELIHYLLSPLQFIVYTLQTKHPNQLQLAQDIWTPTLTKETKELLFNCLTSKEHDILRNLGPAWIRTTEETPQKFIDYRPVFFEGRSLWIQEPLNDQPLQSARSNDERQSSVWSSARQTNPNSNNNGSLINHNTRQPSPTARIDTSTIDRSVKNGGTLENYNTHMQNEHAWAIERKRAGAKIYAVRADRKGQNHKELTVRRGELVEIENNSKKWWLARNFHGDTGHIPHNIVEEIEIEQRPIKTASSNTSVNIPRVSNVFNGEHTDVHQRNGNDYTQYIVRSPSHGNNFIMQSNNSTTTNPTVMRDQFFQETILSPDSATLPSPSSLIPAPPPMPADFLTIRSNPWSTLQTSKSNNKGRPRLDIDLSPTQVDELQKELAERITDRVGFISQKSSKEDVQRWLTSKHISTKLAQNLYGMNGQQLFELSKSTLDGFTNETESARMYALLAQHKQLSGFKSANKREKPTEQHNSSFNSLQASTINSRKASTINDADDSFSLRPDDTLNRSLKFKLKQRRDKIEQSETAKRLVL
ncbi:unnamed protein product [Adineta steineri]|uniref:SH3 domain-containing protein n=1 Tax=Adineta steineri TaxID=433720 RepID=A0A814AMV7_9BILA|nr:unnamed protein product [Adineta steineri]CAF0917643.1 unnamed protein product [Adineta steineri]